MSAALVVDGDPARQIFDCKWGFGLSDGAEINCIACGVDGWCGGVVCGIALDTEKRGYLIKEDIARALASMGGDEAKVTEIVSAMNADHFGHIIFSEFEKCFSSLFVEDEPPVSITDTAHTAQTAQPQPTAPVTVTAVNPTPDSTAPATSDASGGGTGWIGASKPHHNSSGSFGGGTALPLSVQLAAAANVAAATTAVGGSKGQSIGLAARLALSPKPGAGGGGGGAAFSLSKGTGLSGKSGGSGFGSGRLTPGSNGASFRHTLHLNPSALSASRTAEGIQNDTTYDAVMSATAASANANANTNAPSLGIRPKSITGPSGANAPAFPPRSPSFTITLQQPNTPGSNESPNPLPLPSPSAFTTTTSPGAAGSGSPASPVSPVPGGQRPLPRAGSLRVVPGHDSSLAQFQQSLKQSQHSQQSPQSQQPQAGGPSLALPGGTRHNRVSSVGGGERPVLSAAAVFGTRTTGSGVYTGTHLALPPAHQRKRSDRDRSRGSLMEILESKQLATLSAQVAAEEKAAAGGAPATAGTGAATSNSPEHDSKSSHHHHRHHSSLGGDESKAGGAADTDSRMAKLMKLAAWCDSDLTEGQITITELETTAQYLCRAPNEKETDQIVAAFSRQNVDCITCESFRAVLQDCIEYEKSLPPSQRAASPLPTGGVAAPFAAPSASTAAAEAEHERFASVYIESLLNHVRPIRAATPTADELAALQAQRSETDTEFDEAALSASFALIDESKGDGTTTLGNSDLAALKQHIRHLTTVARRATDQFAMAKSHALELEAENDSIRGVYSDLQSELTAARAESREYKDGLEAHKQLLDRVEDQQKELVQAVRELKEEREK